MAQRLKRLPAMRETWVGSLSQEDPLEKEMATHSSTLAWTIPWTEEPGRLQSMGSQESDTNERLHFHFYFLSTGIPSPPLALFVVMLSKAHLTSHSRMSGSR